MGILINEASFKNSRISARKPTTEANTYEVTVLASANTVISPANANRTYITIRSVPLTPGQDIRYDYFDNPNILTEGFLLRAGEAVDLESPQVIYGRAVTSDVVLDIDEGQG